MAPQGVVSIPESAGVNSDLSVDVQSLVVEGSIVFDGDHASERTQQGG